jgi:hypothetical protein
VFVGLGGVVVSTGDWEMVGDKGVSSDVASGGAMIPPPHAVVRTKSVNKRWLRSFMEELQADEKVIVKVQMLNANLYCGQSTPEAIVKWFMEGKVRRLSPVETLEWRSR